ncbi:heat shock protein beta-1-like [Periophthalmus magnuspinnatus]|uniref:SHSP domain-containing protein n=1 Tax=Periophthalmus magnuspinnatus TaxID=409849 RepID=A0A3B4B468_9GOBI|nr:heat shock protein beta-1-like [Periophthalmus magnuspinnatus]
MEENKLIPRPIFRRDADWDPFPNWTQPSRIFAQDIGLPPFLEPGDVDWLEWAKRRLASFSWGLNTKEGLLSPFSGQHLALNQSDLKQLTGAGSEVKDRWKVQLDVKHFSPEELAVTTKDGYLQISGKHEEKQDQHGSVSRCFTRKYKLPLGVELQQASSSLSPDGVLSVEAPVPASSGTGDANQTSTELVIPVQVRHITDQ